MDLSEIGRQFGLNEEQTRAAVEALTPVVAAGMRRSSGGGLGDILGGSGAPTQTAPGSSPRSGNAADDLLNSVEKALRGR